MTSLYALFYDAETTGIPLFSDPSDAPHQPHIVQLAAALVELNSRRTLASFDLVIRPEGWTIPDEVAAIHGISTEQALTMGIGEADAVRLLLQLWQRATVRIAHNEQFDARIIRIACKRYRNTLDTDPEAWKAGYAECTARLAMPYCALPPTDRMKAAKRFHHKTPSLGEAYAHFFGRPLEGGHSARTDVEACIAVYFAIQDHLADAVSRGRTATPNACLTS